MIYATGKRKCARITRSKRAWRVFWQNSVQKAKLNEVEPEFPARGSFKKLGRDCIPTIGRGTPKNQNLKPEPHRIRKNVLVHGIWDSKSELGGGTLHAKAGGVRVSGQNFKKRGWLEGEKRHCEAKENEASPGFEAVRGKSIRGLKAVGAALRRLPDALDMRERTIRLNELVGDKAFGAASRRPSDPLNTRELKIRLNELQERATCLPAAKSPGKKAALEREKMPSSQTERLAPPGLKPQLARTRCGVLEQCAPRSGASPTSWIHGSRIFGSRDAKRACRRQNFRKKGGFECKKWDRKAEVERGLT
ncbi:hypothetical protein C8R47DRAFT_1071161 [Mycena vitilis]|nr:hypothetical protein C8R47DRAFT_1071161 [Mycena vitilis]